MDQEVQQIAMWLENSRGVLTTVWHLAEQDDSYVLVCNKAKKP